MDRLSVVYGVRLLRSMKYQRIREYQDAFSASLSIYRLLVIFLINITVTAESSNDGEIFLSKNLVSPPFLPLPLQSLNGSYICNFSYREDSFDKYSNAQLILSVAIILFITNKKLGFFTKL